MNTPTDVLEVDRSATTTSRLTTDELGDLAPDHVRLRVDRFAVTANTITYAEMGDMLGYWDFYPTGDATWGRVPAMGWADVVESTHPDVEPGGRCYGWFPMAGHVDVKVTPTATGLRDDGDHRVDHAPVYRGLEDTRTDPLYPSDEDDPEAQADLEDRHAILRGLFLTGYLADAFFAANKWFGAEAAVVLSASSKTAISFAECAKTGGPGLIGVTSAANVDFVESLGLYREVVTYADVGTLPVVAAVAIDMAGNGPVLTELHDRFSGRLAHSMIVGRTHNDAPMASVTSGPTPEMFFAPTALQQMREGGADVQTVLADGQRALTDFVARSRDWMTVVRSQGPEEVTATWTEVHAGRVAPAVGRICSLHH